MVEERGKELERQGTILIDASTHVLVHVYQSLSPPTAGTTRDSSVLTIYCIDMRPSLENEESLDCEMID